MSTDVGLCWPCCSLVIGFMDVDPGSFGVMVVNGFCEPPFSWDVFVDRVGATIVPRVFVVSVGFGFTASVEDALLFSLLLTALVTDVLLDSLPLSAADFESVLFVTAWIF